MKLTCEGCVYEHIYEDKKFDPRIFMKICLDCKRTYRVETVYYKTFKDRYERKEEKE